MTIHHPPINLLDLAMFAELDAAAAALEASETSVLVVSSDVDDFFIAHFDVTVLSRLRDRPPPSDSLNPFQELCERYRRLPMATIAVIDGRWGGGGAEFALSLDMRFASPRSILNQPEVALGIIPGGGGTVRHLTLSGYARAFERIVACTDVSAEDAAADGLINRVVPSGELDAHVAGIAERIASMPLSAIRAAKLALAHDDLAERLLREQRHYVTALTSDEAGVRLDAFLRAGGQEVEAELRLGSVLGDLGRRHP
jgi:enoyl-CoA hydratase/carnithine racemase